MTCNSMSKFTNYQFICQSEKKVEGNGHIEVKNTGKLSFKTRLMTNENHFLVSEFQNTASSRFSER